MAEITVADDAMLRSKENVHAVGKAFKAAGKSRFEMPDWLTKTIMHWLENGGIVLDTHGQEIVIDEDAVEAAFDPAQWFSWVTDVQKFADRLPMRRAKKNLIPRLRVIDLAYRIVDQPLI